MFKNLKKYVDSRNLIADEDLLFLISEIEKKLEKSSIKILEPEEIEYIKEVYIKDSSE